MEVTYGGGGRRESQHVGQTTGSDHGERRGCRVLATNSNRMNPKVIRIVFLKDVQGMGGGGENGIFQYKPY